MVTYLVKADVGTEKVEVHNRVNTVVHGCKPDPWTDHNVIRVPTVHEHSDVVKPVQENDGLATKHHEDCIEEFRDLAVNEQRHPIPTRSISIPRRIGADGSMETFGLKLVEQCGHHLEMWRIKMVKMGGKVAKRCEISVWHHNVPEKLLQC
jgi:hypothetical protein